MRWMTLASTVFLSLIFLYAGFDKVVHYDGFVNALGSYVVVPSGLAAGLAPTLILLEILIAVGLVFPSHRSRAALAGALALGNWKAIWPVFGAANQLIASLVLIVTSVYLMARKNNFLFAAIPAVIMLMTTIGALVYNTYCFITADKPNILLATIDVVLIVLALFLAYTPLTIYHHYPILLPFRDGLGWANCNTRRFSAVIAKVNQKRHRQTWEFALLICRHPDPLGGSRWRIMPIFTGDPASKASSAACLIEIDSFLHFHSSSFST